MGEGPAKDIEEADELLASMYRYFDAARQGTARINLRLMAKVMRGQFEREKISASDFLRYAAVLSTLTEEEIIFLATLCQHYREPKGQDPTRIYRGVVEELAGGVNERQRELKAIATGLQRRA